MTASQSESSPSSTTTVTAFPIGSRVIAFYKRNHVEGTLVGVDERDYSVGIEDSEHFGTVTWLTKSPRGPWLVILAENEQVQP